MAKTRARDLAGCSEACSLALAGGGYERTGSHRVTCP